MGILKAIFGTKAQAPDWAAPLTADQYRELLDVVRRQLESVSTVLRFGDGVVEVSYDGRTIQCGLHNLAKLCAGLKRERWPEVVAEHFSAVLRSNADDEAFDELVAEFSRARELVKLRLYPEEMGEPGESMVSWPVAPGLRSALTFDLPTAIGNVKVEHLERWGLDREEVRDVALENLAAEPVPEPKRLSIKDRAEIELRMGSSFYTASHALRLAVAVPGLSEHGALVAVPDRATLLVHPIRDRGVLAAIPAMRRIADRHWRELPGALSPSVYWWTAERWVHIPIELVGDTMNVMVPSELTAVLKSLGIGRPA